jgi:2-oxoglutarate ferredoxin oxidoreductase subunit beta
VSSADLSAPHEAVANGRGLSLVPKSEIKLGMKDFKTDQEVRWCPGCGDYAILSAVQAFVPELGLKRENMVFVSGIGCSSRFPYYMNTYGFHSIHGRAPAIATGLASSRPDLSVWVITGDGDALSIGGNHLIHALRRNVNLNILLFNNRIYGLTKGQYSPTSEIGKITKSTPMGSLDKPFNPISLAIGAEATFVARTVDTDKQHLPAMLRAAAEHDGSALIEIYQNCPVFNDGAFDALRDKKANAANGIRLEHGRPIRFGLENERCVVRGADGDLRIAEVADVAPEAIVVHDAHREDPSLAFALSRLSAQPTGPTPIGIFRSVQRPVSGRDLGRELARNRAGAGEADLDALLHSGDTWTVA